MDSRARRIEFSVESARGAATQARAALLPFSEVLSAEAYSDLKLIVSELVANSVTYGPSGQIDVEVELRVDGSIVGTVADEGQGITGTEKAYVEPGEGLGLLIVEALAEHWGMEPGRSRVWFELKAQRLASQRDTDRRIQGLPDEG
jgi:two-component sensor histidine kinase